MYMCAVTSTTKVVEHLLGALAFLRIFCHVERDRDVSLAVILTIYKVTNDN